MKNFLISAIVIIAIVALAFAYIDSTTVKTSTAITETAVELPEQSHVSEQEQAELKLNEQRVAQMQERYTLLEQERTDLRRELGKLKAQLWNVKLPPERARKITEDMSQAFTLLKNPPMLGAFHDIAGIEREYGRVSNSLAAVQLIRQSLADVDKAK